ncbi:hypothetical protein AMATHDRAFT_68552 [Amanita thiersii Skay4041]|uniref:Uncharacterized protein n=1 Tax=Amanita thiersii Skay4041 TaxID=703135 RepID=A0A2A9NFJ1_9AGAR|nr:hypothetical protein AMATHDRAFT_68552 [Amanita thiersii Skay4041]
MSMASTVFQAEFNKIRRMYEQVLHCPMDSMKEYWSHVSRSRHVIDPPPTFGSTQFGTFNVIFTSNKPAFAISS